MYNLAAEFSAIIIMLIALVGLFIDRSAISPRYKGLKWMYYSCLIASIITVICLITTNYYESFSLVTSEFFRTMFFASSPLLSVLYLFFVLSIIYNKMSMKQLLLKYKLMLIPYLIYIIFVFANPIHKLIFEYSYELGYVKHDFIRISYYIAFIYFVILIYITNKNIKSFQKPVLLIVCLNYLISTLIFTLQIIMPLVQLSGIACASGLLVTHLYILSVSKASDPLTELYNRQTLTNDLKQLIANKQNFSLIVFSLRNFKSINERYGLQYGDELLCDLALRFRNSLHYRHLYRYSGDEFAFLATNTDGLNEILKDVVLDSSQPFNILDATISVDMVYARVDFPQFGENAKEILSSIDYSISLVKKNYGETNFFYNVDISSQMKHRNFIIERLKQAIAQDGFEVHYQPIYSSKANAFTMAEALVRMKGNSMPMISPGEFIPIAEETGLVSKITYIVLEKICSDFRILMDTYDDFPLESISINFPYVHFLQKDTVNEVVDILDKYNIPYNKIKMELTERTLISDTTSTKNVMDEFINRGFEFELDDFGIEYSNLSLFFDIPIKIIKFDKSLVYGATSNPTRRKFLEHLLSAIRAIDIQVVMEGVEDEELLNYLISCGCSYIQGYVFSKALPFQEFTDFLLNSKNNKLIKSNNF